MSISRRIEIVVALIAAVAAVFVLTACGGSGQPSAAPSAAAATTPADPCAALTAWRDGSGSDGLRKVGRALSALAADATNGNSGALDGDGQRLYAAATAAQADPPPVARADYLKALKLAAKAAVDAQSGDYQAADTAITETGDLFDVMTSTVKGKCG